MQTNHAAEAAVTNLPVMDRPWLAPSWPCKVCNAEAPLAFTRVGTRNPLLEKKFRPDDYERPYYLCKNCGMLFHTGFDLLTEEQQAQTVLPGVLNKGADVINRAIRELYMTVNLMQMFGLHNKSKLLVFGCGAGLSFNMMLQNNMNAYATDLTLQFKEAAQAFDDELFRKSLLPDMLHRFRKLEDIRPGSLGLITLTEVFEHLLDPVDMMQRLTSLVRPGGIVIGTTGWVDRVREPLKDWWYIQCLSHSTFLSSESFRRICAACGCTGVMLPGSPGITGPGKISDTQTVFVLQKPL
ncbi:MAG: methyltransferase domain-containing protein [Desulfovibrionaceae bacterium]